MTNPQDEQASQNALKSKSNKRDGNPVDIDFKCQNPNCDKKTNSEHSKFCKKCSLRWQGKKAGYTLDEEEIEGEDFTGFILERGAGK